MSLDVVKQEFQFLEERTKRMLFEAYLDAFSAAGIPSLVEAERILRDVKAGKPIGKSLIRAAHTTLQIGNLFEQEFRALPEPSPAELEKTLNTIRNQAPYMLRDRLQEFSSELPHRPGGRPRKLTPKQELKAAELVGKLRGQGQSLPEALKNVAERFVVSAKTIQRAWQKVQRTRKNR